MSGQTRQKLLVELSAISLAGGTNQVVKDNLEITDTDLSGVEADIGDIEIRIDQVETDLEILETTVEDVSGNLSIDIDNLDLAFTQLIAQQVPMSEVPAVTGTATNLIGHLEVTLNGVPYKLALIS